MISTLFGLDEGRASFFANTLALPAVIFADSMGADALSEFQPLRDSVKAFLRSLRNDGGDGLLAHLVRLAHGHRFPIGEERLTDLLLYLCNEWHRSIIEFAGNALYTLGGIRSRPPGCGRIRDVPMMRWKNWCGSTALCKTSSSP